MTPPERMKLLAVRSPSVGKALAWAVSATSLVLTIVFGDGVMVAIVGATRALYGGTAILQWLIASLIIAVGGFLLIGVPQLVAWRNTKKPDRLVTDPRSQWSVRLATAGGVGAFVLATLVGGCLPIAWYCGRDRVARPYLKTALAAALFAVVWAAIYLQIIAVAT